MKFCRGNISLNPGDVQLRDICYLPKYMKNCCYFSSNYFLEINNFLYQNFKLYVYFLHFCCELFRWNKKLLSMRLWILEWDTLFLIFLVIPGIVDCGVGSGFIFGLQTFTKIRQIHLSKIHVPNSVSLCCIFFW